MKFFEFSSLLQCLVYLPIGGMVTELQRRHAVSNRLATYWQALRLFSAARLMFGIEYSSFQLVQENDSFFLERDFFMILWRSCAASWLAGAVALAKRVSSRSLKTPAC